MQAAEWFKSIGAPSAYGIGLVAGLLWFSRKCFFRVNEGHVAVLTTFGAAEHQGAEPKLFEPGLHFKKPWQHVVSVSLKEQNLDLSGETGGRTAMAADGTVLRFDSNLRFVPLRKELGRFLFGMKRPIEHITGLFTCLLRNEIANFKAGDAQTAEGGSYAMIRKHRSLLNQHIAEFCQKEIAGQYGVHFNAVDLTDILPPDELAVALNTVMNARTEADAKLFRSESEMRQRVLAAEQGVEIAKAKASAVESEMVTLAQFLAELSKKGLLKDYVARRRDEVLNNARTVYVKDAEVSS